MRPRYRRLQWPTLDRPSPGIITTMRINEDLERS